MELDLNEQQAILSLARFTIENNLNIFNTPEPELPDNLFRKGSAFVTLYKNNKLRGCVGSFDFSKDLSQVIREMAISASSQDTRFAPVTPDEVPELAISVSVLTPPFPIEDLKEIQVGLHGILITQQWHRGVLLPKVAVEYNWDRDTFLAHTCQKAGLPPDAYKTFGKNEYLQIDIFTCQDFAEKDFYLGE